MNIRATFILITGLALLGVCGEPPARAAEEDTTARLREMLHRTQEALRQAQSDNADLSRAKIEAEAKLQSANKDLLAASGVSKAELALRGQLQTTKAARDDLTHRLGEATDQLSVANAKLSDTASWRNSSKAWSRARLRPRVARPRISSSIAIHRIFCRPIEKRACGLR
jgi:hypothetical protein